MTMLEMILPESRRQVRSHTSIAVTVLAGGVAARVAEMRWSSAMVTTTCRERRSRGCGRRAQESQEMATRRLEGR